MTVSRQAISKWELDSSIPDTDNVVQLSKLFDVSTDYLLNDEIEYNIKDTIVKSDTNGNKFEIHTKTAFIIGMGMIVIGLLSSFVGWEMHQTTVAVGIGFVIQILGIIAFEVICKECDTRRLFYAVSCWMISPFIILFISQTLMRFYPRPYSFWTIGILQAILYFSICGISTLFLMTREKSK